MIKIIVQENPFDSDDTFELTGASVYDIILSHYGEWPKDARLYQDQPAASHEVTPYSQSEMDALPDSGTFYLILKPGVIASIIVAAVAVAATLVGFLLAPSFSARNTNNPSPNNAFETRQNQVRIGERIPDIVGDVRSIPDLIAPNYVYFDNHVEIERSLMTTGRGLQAIDDIRDGDTLIENIEGASIAIYPPNTSPISGVPQQTIGAPITQTIIAARRSNNINGQVLLPPNTEFYRADENIEFIYPNVIRLTGDFDDIDFTELFTAGDDVRVSRATLNTSSADYEENVRARFIFPNQIERESGTWGSVSSNEQITISDALVSITTATGTVNLNLNGTYLITSVSGAILTLASPENINGDWALLDSSLDDQTNFLRVGFFVPASQSAADLAGEYSILSVTSTQLNLSDPESVNANWLALTSLPGQTSGNLSPLIQGGGIKWTGWETIDQSDRTGLIANVVARQGLFADDGEEQIAQNVVCRFEVQKIDNNDNPVGAVQSFSITVFGSNTSRSTRAASLITQTTMTGRARVRAARISSTDRDFEGQVIDEIQWRDLFGTAQVPDQDFGDITILDVLTIGTPSALAVKERQLNCRVRRRIPIRQPDGTFLQDPQVTRYAGDIIAFLAQDEFNGRITPLHVDLDQIYETLETVEAYFGTREAVSLSHTFDDDQISFEEMLQAIAQSCFCTAYVEGSSIKFNPDIAGDEFGILFNARNIMPSSMRKRTTFGPISDNDGAEIQYRDGTNRQIETIAKSVGNFSQRPRQLDLIGIDSRIRAILHLHRNLNRIQYQRDELTFDGLEEAGLLVRGDKFGASNITSANNISGAILSQSGLNVTFDRPHRMLSSEKYQIFIQHLNATVESMRVRPHESDPRVGVLDRIPREPLAIDIADSRVRFTIVPIILADTQRYLMTGRSTDNRLVHTVEGVNYDWRYYEHDNAIFWLNPTDSPIVDRSYRENQFSISGVSVQENSSVDYFSSDGVTGIVPVPAVDLAETFTLSMWIRERESGAQLNGNLFTFSGSRSLSISSRVVNFSQGSDNIQHTLEDGNDVFITLTYNQAKAILYVDGQPVQSLPLTGIQSGQIIAAGVFDGLFGDMRIINRVLTELEILTLFRTSRPR